MALTLQLRKKEVFNDQSGITMEDISDNYGNGNAERSDLGLFLYAFVMDKNGVEVSQITIGNGNYDTATEWFVPTTKDSWIKFYLLGVNNWTFDLAGVLYSVDNVRQYDGKIYKSIITNTAFSVNDDPASNPTKWAEVTNFKDILDNSDMLTDIYFLEYDDVQDVGVGKQTVELADIIPCVLAGNCDSEAKAQDLEKIMLYIDGMNIKFWAEEPQRGAAILEGIQRKLTDILE